jgi:hypothetical protein
VRDVYACTQTLLFSQGGERLSEGDSNAGTQSLCPLMVMSSQLFHLSISLSARNAANKTIYSRAISEISYRPSFLPGSNCISTLPYRTRVSCSSILAAQISSTTHSLLYIVCSCQAEQRRTKSLLNGPIWGQKEIAGIQTLTPLWTGRSSPTMHCGVDLAQRTAPICSNRVQTSPSWWHLASM